MCQAIARYVANGMRGSAHIQKSSSANLAALRLGSFCKSLEVAGRVQTPHDAAPLLAWIEGDYARVLTMLTAECENSLNVVRG